MPLYEYQCTKCETRFELIQKFSAASVAKCTECGAKSERLLSAPAIQFKGSGWYVTDYANKSGSPDGKPEKADKTADASNGSGESSKDGTKTSTQDGKKTAAKDSATKESKPAKKEKGKGTSSAKP